MFDSHCHLHDARVVGEVVKQVDEARAAGVVRMLLAGVEAAGWAEQARLVAAHRELYSSYGLHPQLIPQLDDNGVADELATLEQKLTARVAQERVVALGEIGLDGIGERRQHLPRQAEAFTAQLQLATRLGLPVCLHILRAHGEALALLRRVGVPREGGVVHSYSGSPELVREYLELGLHLSYSGSVTWQGANRAARSAKVTPLDRLLVETDAPDQTPDTMRPQPNRPAFLVAIVERVAQIRGETAAAIARVTDENACRLFGIAAE